MGKMNYTYVDEITGAEQKFTIDVDEINRFKTANRCATFKEAVELWLFDHDKIGNAEAEALTAKAAKAGVGAKATGEKKPRKKPVRKPNPVKRELINKFQELLSSLDNITDVNVTNAEREITFKVADNEFYITLAQRRAKK